MVIVSVRLLKSGFTACQTAAGNQNAKAVKLSFFAGMALTLPAIILLLAVILNTLIFSGA
jgi:hypothetical protein